MTPTYVERRTKHGGVFIVRYYRAAPLRKAVRSAADRFTTHTLRDGGERKSSYRSGIRPILEQYAMRYDIDLRSATRQWSAISNDRLIPEWMADRWACFLGLHPVLLWPEWQVTRRGQQGKATA